MTARRSGPPKSTVACSFGRRIVEGDHSVNVSRQGVVWLPAVGRRSAEWLTALPGLVAAGSFALYEALLELDE